MNAGGQEGVWSRTKTGVVVRIRLTPKSSRDAIDGLTETAEGKAVKARVRAVPEDGAANAAAVQLVAKWLGVPKSSASVAAGHKSRIKMLALAGEPDGLAALVAERIAQLDTTTDSDRS